MALGSNESPVNPEVRPCLAKLLQTCFHPPTLVLHIDKVQIEDHAVARVGHPTSTDHVQMDEDGPQERKRAYRLFLSDGVLVLQALLGKRLLRSGGLDKCVVGNMVVLKKFRLRRAKRVNGQGHVVFLGVEDCDFVDSTGQLQHAAGTKRSSDEYLMEKDEEQSTPIKRVKFDHQPPTGEAVSRHAQGNGSPRDGDSDDEFETSVFDLRTLESRREALQERHEKSSLVSSKSSAPPQPGVNKTSLEQPPPRSTTTITPFYTAMPKTPPHHTLTSLTPTPPLPRSYHCTLFAIITWTSPNLIHPSNNKKRSNQNQQQQQHPQHSSISSSSLPQPPIPTTAFPPKRHIKIHDSSIPTRHHPGITVAVYCNAPSFKPKVGTIALFRDLVAQRAVGAGATATSTATGTAATATRGGDVILNAYPRLMDQKGVGGIVGRWFEDDRHVLRRLGLDVDGLEAWWRREGRVG